MDAKFKRGPLFIEKSLQSFLDVDLGWDLDIADQSVWGEEHVEPDVGAGGAGVNDVTHGHVHEAVHFEDKAGGVRLVSELHCRHLACTVGQF